MNLKVGCKPFDELPFSFSLCNHNPAFYDLACSIPPDSHKPEFLARRLIINAEQTGNMYTPVAELNEFEDIDGLATEYNSRLYHRHQHACVEINNGFAYIRNYESNVHEILLHLKGLAESGIKGYRTIAEAWMNSVGVNVDCAEKQKVLKEIFSDSRVALIYGAAGTGKSTLINYISHIFADSNKVFIANTNPAVENLRRKVNAPNATYMTIASYLSRGSVGSDILVIDECSTVCNGDILAILRRGSFRLLVLVGDMYQIEAIRFGNWFGISHSYFRGNFKVDLTVPYRTSNQNLLDLWSKVRQLSPDILEHLARNNYSSNLDQTIFTKAEKDEIILCLNYSGLYGINNINRFLQHNNPNPPVAWGLHSFKIGDPVLFNETDRFAPYLHNNLKGEIVDILLSEGGIYFTLRVEAILSSFDLENTEICYVSATEDGEGTIIRIFVKEEYDSDNDIDNSDSVIPFQIAYAVSIHKAQGLEYKSVKIVVTKDVEDMITHNIFYTAITRTKDKLKIYWTPETEKHVLENLKKLFNVRDYNILRSKFKDL